MSQNLDWLPTNQSTVSAPRDTNQPIRTPYKLQEPQLYDWHGTFRQLYELQQRGTLCDIALHTRGGSVAAHCLVLFTRVPYFKALFEFSADRCKISETDLRNYTITTVETVMKFVYTGRVEINSLQNLTHVFCLADFLQISNLRDQCEAHIFSALSLENCVELANFSLGYSTIISQHHRSRVFDFLLSRWNYVVETENWTELKYGIFRKLVLSDVFNVRNEEQVLCSVLQWVSAESSRRTKLQSLLQDVRLHAVPEEFLNNLETNPLVHSSAGCRRLIDEGRYFASNIRCDTAHIRLKPRTYMDKCVYVFCMYKAYPPEVQYPRPDFSNVVCPRTRDSLVRQYDTRYSAAYNEQYNNCNVLVFSKIHEHWEQPLDHVVKSWAQETAIAPLGDSLYLLGNRQWECGEVSPDDEIYNKVVSFDRLSLTWKEYGKLPFPVMFNSCGSVCGRLYSCGGVNLSHVVEEYCIPTLLLSREQGSEWEIMSEMSCARRNHGAAALDGKIYVTGGEAKDEDLNPCPFSESWDPGTNRWVSFTNPNINRTKFSICNSSDRVFVFGGFNMSPDQLCNDYTWESYDPRMGVKWGTPQEIPGKYSDFTTACLEDEIYMMGGSTGINQRGEDEWTRDVHVLDLRAMSWRRGAPLPLRPPPDMCEVDVLLSEVAGLEIPVIPIPTGAAVLT